MKIRVTLIVLLCTSFAVFTKNTIKAQWIPSNSRFLKRRNLIESAIPTQSQVYEYSRGMNAVNVEFRNGSNLGTIIEPMYHSEIVAAKNLPIHLDQRRDNESGKSLQQQNTIKVNSKELPQISEVGILRRVEKVLSRGRKHKMDQAVLALLMAYKMKFTALIPILLGGLSLLASTTALAGFFFALFAAVLGLKTH